MENTDNLNCKSVSFSFNIYQVFMKYNFLILQLRIMMYTWFSSEILQHLLQHTETH